MGAGMNAMRGPGGMGGLGMMRPGFGGPAGMSLPSPFTGGAARACLNE